MIIFLLWIVFTILVTALGSDRKIGGFTSFAISFFLSPLIGLIVVLTSDKLTDLELVKHNLQSKNIELGQKVFEVISENENIAFSEIKQKTLLPDELLKSAITYLLTEKFITKSSENGAITLYNKI